MSRNKTIKTMHRITGEPFSVCRAKLKANHWELLPAMGYPDLSGITDALRNFGDVVVEVAKQLAKMLEDLYLDDVLRVYKELKERQYNRLEQCTALHCTDAGCEGCAGYEPIGGWL